MVTVDHELWSSARIYRIVRGIEESERATEQAMLSEPADEQTTMRASLDVASSPESSTH
jgi:hypothetical protein